MELTLTDAASLLGKTPRQVRYLLKQGGLKARKVGGRWMIDSDSLPLSPQQLQRRLDKAAQLDQVVRDALGPLVGRRGRAYSVTDMVAWQRGEPLYRAVAAEVGIDASPTVDLREALTLLLQGCHRFHTADKVDAYRAARDRVAVAVGALLLSDDEGHRTLGLRVESEWLPVLAGLLRRTESRRRR